MNNNVNQFIKKYKELFNKPFNQIDWVEIYTKASEELTLIDIGDLSATLKSTLFKED